MSKYAEAGVDVKKKGIEAFKPLVENLFPEAFCVVVKDPENPKKGLVFHADSAGSKPIQSYIHWKETDDINWFKGLAQDVIAMNLDDIICVGAKPLSFIDYVALNPYRITKEELLKTLSLGFKECIALLENCGISLSFAGGETADLPDQIQTLDISGAIHGRVELSRAITGRKISPGNLIIGLRSGGRAKYEKNENSGIMCNGITLARLCLMSNEYAKKYPEISYAGEGRYQGRFRFDDYLEELDMTVGEAILSPTRIFAPVIVKVLEKYGEHITGLIHNTGGGQTKCLRVGRNIHYVKDNLPEPDPIFKLIQRETGESWRNMFETFNMGVGFEIIVEEEVAEEVLSIPEKFGIEARVIGRCEKSDEGNKLTIKSELGKFRYT